MSRHIVCLTFDFDAMSGFISRGMKTPTPISRGEFGVVGVARVLELLARRGIDATWFIPGVVIETYPEVCARIAEAGHEIGHHGWTHVPLADLSRDHEHAGLVRGNPHRTTETSARPRVGAHTLELSAPFHSRGACAVPVNLPLRPILLGDSKSAPNLPYLAVGRRIRNREVDFEQHRTHHRAGLCLSAG